MFRGFFADDSAPGEVRRHAYLGLREWLPNEAHALSLQAMASDYSSLRYAALCYFGEQKEQSLREKYESLLSDHDYSMRSKSLEILSELFPEDAVSFAEKLISDDYWLMRQKAAQIFGEHGTAEHLPKLEVLLQDSDSDVRREAFKAAVSLGPERKLRLALGQIGSYDHETKTLAEEIVADVNDPQLLTEAAVQALQDINNQSETAKKLFAMLADDAPDKIPDVLGLLHKMESDYDAQEFFKRCLNEDVPLPVEQLESIMEQNDSDSVRRQAFEKLCELRPGDRLVLIVKALEDNSWEMRQHALRLIQEEDEPDPALVDDLLPMCRDQDYDVRQAALHTIAKFNDIRAFGEIVASLQDENDTVRELAQALLSGEHGNLPVMKRFARFNQKSKVPVWEKMREQVAEVNEWASKIGYELLGKTVFVTQPGLKGAEDEPESARKSIVEIELPETPITHFYDDGQEVMKALALYKLGHYLCNEGTRGYKTMCGIAKSEGIRELYDLLTHERIERNLRSRRDEWGPLLDRLTSYAFSKTIYRVPIEQYAQLVDEPDEVVLEQIRSGALPGQLLPVSRARPRQVVSLRDRDMIKIPNALPPLIAFLWCLRCGYDAALHPNPVVAEALALIPSNLRTMKHAEVLQVARDISALLGACEQHKQQFQELMDKLQGKKKQQGQQGQQGACSGGQPGEGQPGGAGQPGGMGSPGMGQRLRKSGGMGSMMERHLQRLREMGMSPNWMSPPDSAPRTGKHSRRVRKQRQVIYRRMPSSGRKLPGGQAINLGNELGFDLLPNERSLPVDPQAHAQLVGPIRKHIRRLRSYFERLGRSTQDEYASRRGARLDVSQARRLIYTNTPNLLVHSHEEIMADMYLGILIDRSGSMDGEKIRVAKSFGSLVLESARSIRGIEGHINAFDDDTFIYLGNFQRSSVSSLEAGGGNNDAGGLHRAAQLALHSRKKNKLLVMISDGAPTECTFEALKGFVARLEREYNIRCAQVAVESLDQIAFPHYVDLSAYSLDEAVGHFGKLLIRLTSSWR
jgi:HEAT repeat protein